MADTLIVRNVPRPLDIPRRKVVEWIVEQGNEAFVVLRESIAVKVGAVVAGGEDIMI